MSDEHPRAAMDKYFAAKLPTFYAAVKESRIPVSVYAAPCLPYIGSAFCDERSPRVLFVGKATYGWGCLTEAIDERWTAGEWIGDSESFILERVLPFFGRLQPGPHGCYHSSFWRRIYSLTCRLSCGRADLSYEREADQARRCFATIAWTNLFKVGTVAGNPDGRMAELLLTHLNTLPDEIRILRPRVVVFSTGSTYDYWLSRSLVVFGAKVEVPSERISAVSGLPGVKCALRTPHFQACTTEEFDELCRTVVRLSAD